MRNDTIDTRHFEGDDVRVAPLEQQWPALRFLGLGAWWAWIWLAYESTILEQGFPAENNTYYVIVMFVSSTIAVALATLAWSLRWKRTEGLVERPAVVYAFACLACAASFCQYLAGVYGAGPVFSVCAVLSGVGTSVLCVRAGQIYGSVGLGESLVGGALSLLFAVMLYFVCCGLPAVVQPLFLSLLPFLSALLFSMKVDDSFGSAELPFEGRLSELRGIMGRVVTAVALVAFTAGVGKGVSVVSYTPFEFSQIGAVCVVLVGFVSVAVLWAVNRYGAVRAASKGYTALILLGISLMMGTCFGVPIALLSVGKDALWLMFTVFMAYISFRASASPVRAFGFGQAMYFFGSVAGWIVGCAIAPYYGDLLVRAMAGMGMAFLVVVVILYLLPENRVANLVVLSGEEPSALAHEGNSAFPLLEGDDAAETADGDAALSIGAGAALAADDGEEAPGEDGGTGSNACASVSAGRPDGPYGYAGLPLYGLSARELEVMHLYAQGRSANWIAEKLVISSNTVRTHLRAVYGKLDVHSRQELLDFIDQGPRA
jgi:DNA-binding CsgD family transcriptional regulator